MLSLSEEAEVSGAGHAGPIGRAHSIWDMPSSTCRKAGGWSLERGGRADSESWRMVEPTPTKGHLGI